MLSNSNVSSCVTPPWIYGPAAHSCVIISVAKVDNTSTQECPLITYQSGSISHLTTACLLRSETHYSSASLLVALLRKVPLQLWQHQISCCGMFSFWACTLCPCCAYRHGLPLPPHVSSPEFKGLLLTFGGIRPDLLWPQGKQNQPMNPYTVGLSAPHASSSKH